MHFLITLILVVAVHLARAVTAWTQVGLLADDRHMVGAAVLRHRGMWSFGSMFAPDGPAPVEAATALYRPFIDLGFWLEQPWFGVDATGYHVVNSVLHCGTAMLWFLLVRRLSGSGAAALACALLFVGWPSHSEVTHWIAARVNLQSTFLLSLSLLVLDIGLCRTGRVARWVAFASAALLATIAVGSKESGVFVLPLAACLAWLRTEQPTLVERSLHAVLPPLPMAVALACWLAWRAHVIGTWGAGTHYGWHAARINWQVCSNWFELLLAPRHHGFLGAWWSVAQWALHGVLLAAVVFACRRPAARPVAAIGALLLLMGYVAGIGLESMSPVTLENARYSYEPVLGLCLLGGVGIAALPGRARGLLLAALVLVHAVVLDGNRQSWLRAAAVYQRMERDIQDIAAASQQPIRVLQAPGVYEGAFAYLNGFTEFQFMQAFAPPGTDLRGKVSSTLEWHEVLFELGAAAAAMQSPANAFVVQWRDGALARFAFDAQWPQQPQPGVRVDYAWAPRVRPFVGAQLPVQVLLHTDQPVTLRARAHVEDRRWQGPELRCAAGSVPQPLQVSLVLPPDAAVDVPVQIELLVEVAGREHLYSLGVVVPAARPTH